MATPSTKKSKPMATAPKYLDLKAQIKALEEQSEAARLEELETVIADMKLKIEEYGISASELGFTVTAPKGSLSKAIAAATTKAEAKYKNDAGETWSGGRGRKPEWVKKITEAGGNIEDYLINA